MSRITVFPPEPMVMGAPPTLHLNGEPLVVATYHTSQMELDLLENWFTHHWPTMEQVEQYQRIRSEGHRFAAILTALIPPCPDRSVAIRKVREAVMTANAAIACGGR